MFNKEKKSTRELLGIEKISDYSIITKHGEIVFFLLKPSNLSVMSQSSVSAKINSLMTVLKSLPELRMLCLNSKENFDENKSYIEKRMDSETNPKIRKLLELDSKNLDKIQVSMATAREFAVSVRLKNEKEKDKIPSLNRTEKCLKDAGFSVKQADKHDIQRIISVYFEQNVTSERSTKDKT